MRRFDDFLDELTTEVWDQIFLSVASKKEIFAKSISGKAGMNETQKILRSNEALITLELLELYHNWLSYGFADSEIN